MCKRRKRDAQNENAEVEGAVWRLMRLYEEAHGITYQRTWRLNEDSEPEDDEADNNIEMVQAAGELFTAKEAIVAAIKVATALAFNNECGFEKLINPEPEPEDVNKTYGKRMSKGVYEKTILRLAYIADPRVITHATMKAASALGGVSVRPGLIAGKDGMPNVGHVDEAVPRKFINRVLYEKLHKTQYFGFSDRERDQIGHLLKYDDKAIASICDCVLAASCVSRIIEKNVCMLDAEHLKCKMFRGGRKASGNMPTRE